MSLDAQVAALTSALQAIHAEGKVCAEYETCTHVACQSSHTAWAIADAALANAPTDLADLLAAHDELTAQVAALHDALRRLRHAVSSRSAWRAIEAGGGDARNVLDVCDTTLANTAAAAEAFKRQQRLEGAQDLWRRTRVKSRPFEDGYEYVSLKDVSELLADMEREASA